MAVDPTTFRVRAVDETRAAFSSVEANLRRLSGTARVLNTALAGLGVGVSAAAFVGLVRNSIDAADQLNKLSQKVGISVESLSALRYAAKLSDVEIGTLQTSLVRFNVALDAARAGSKEQAEAFARLGLNAKAFGNTAEAFAAVADRLSQTRDGAAKTAISVALFGRAGADLVPVLNQLSGGLGQIKSEAEAAGQVISTRTARAAEEFNDNITRLQGNLSKLGNVIASTVVGPLRDLTDRLVAASQAGGIVGLLLGEGGGQSADQKIGEIQKKLEELRRTREALVKLPALQRAFSADDIAILNVQIAATEKQLAYLRQLQKIRDDAGRKRMAGDLGIGGLAEDAPSAPGKTKDANQAKREAERRAKELADINQRAQDSIAAATANAQRASVQALLDGLDERTRATRDAMEEEERLAKEAAQVQMDFDEQVNRAWFEGILKRYDDQVKAQEEASRKAAATARDLGFVFRSAFEDAIVEGENLREVLRGLLQDIARLIVRKAVTEPIAGAISGVLGSIFGGFFADGGYLPSGKLGIVGERGPELISGGRTGATIAPMGGGVTIVQNISIDSRSDQASILAAMRIAKEQAKAEILDSRRRGGVFA